MTAALTAGPGRQPSLRPGNRRFQVWGGRILLAVGLWQVGSGVAIHAKADMASVLLRWAWARMLADGGTVRHRPWPWADHWPVARLTVPALGIDRIVLSGGAGASLAFAPGHVDGTALPGQVGNAVIGGHRDTHFRFLQQATPGTEIIVHRADGATIRFHTTPGIVVDGTQTAIAVDVDRPVLTLVTCWPFDGWVPGGPERYVVVAESRHAPPPSRPRPL